MTRGNAVTFAEEIVVESTRKTGRVCSVGLRRMRCYLDTGWMVARRGRVFDDMGQ